MKYASCFAPSVSLKKKKKQEYHLLNCKKHLFLKLADGAEHDAYFTRIIYIYTLQMTKCALLFSCTCINNTTGR